MQLISEQQQYMNFKSGAQAQLIFRTVKLKTDSLTWLEKICRGWLLIKLYRDNKVDYN